MRCVSIHPPIPTTFDEVTISLTSQTSRRLGTFSRMDLTFYEWMHNRGIWGVGNSLVQTSIHTVIIDFNWPQVQGRPQLAGQASQKPTPRL